MTRIRRRRRARPRAFAEWAMAMPARDELERRARFAVDACSREVVLAARALRATRSVDLVAARAGRATRNTRIVDVAERTRGEAGGHRRATARAPGRRRCARDAFPRGGVPRVLGVLLLLRHSSNLADGAFARPRSKTRESCLHSMDRRCARSFLSSSSLQAPPSEGAFLRVTPSWPSRRRQSA